MRKRGLGIAVRTEAHAEALQKPHFVQRAASTSKRKLTWPGGVWLGSST